MLEQETIISKLESEGIDKSLASGINFETEEALNSWVGVAKTFVEKPKSIENYSAEELEALLRDPQPKAKGLQSLMDKERARIREKMGKQEPPKEGEETPEQKALRERLEALEAGMTQSKEEIAAEKRNLLIEKETQGLEELEVELIKNSIPKDADAQTIKAKVEAYKNMQAKKGLKGYVSAGDGDKKAGELPADFKSAMSNFVSSKTKK